jgi:hypothetical protein
MKNLQDIVLIMCSNDKNTKELAGVPFPQKSKLQTACFLISWVLIISPTIKSLLSILLLQILLSTNRYSIRMIIVLIMSLEGLPTSFNVFSRNPHISKMM